MRDAIDEKKTSADKKKLDVPSKENINFYLSLARQYAVIHGINETYSWQRMHVNAHTHTETNTRAI